MVKEVWQFLHWRVSEDMFSLSMTIIRRSATINIFDYNSTFCGIDGIGNTIVANTATPAVWFAAEFFNITLPWVNRQRIKCLDESRMIRQGYTFKKSSFARRDRDALGLV